MVKKIALTLAAALIAGPAFAGKLAVPGANDPSGTVVIPQGLADALGGATGRVTVTTSSANIANLVAMATRLLNTGSVQGDPSAAADSDRGRYLVLNGVDIVDKNGRRLTADVTIDRQTNVVTITKVGSGTL